MSEPLVSVIITTYNRSELVGDAIESVLAQTYSNFELIVVDDASTDDTKSVVKAYDRLTYVRHETNQHLSAARNTGINRSSGDFIAFLDDDDEWLATKLEQQVERFQSVSNDVGLVYCWMNYYQDDEIIKEYHPRLQGDIYPETLGRQPLGNGSTWLVDAEVFDRVGVFDEEIRRGIDGDFLRRASREYHVAVVPEVLTIYNVGHESRRITEEDEDSINAAIEGQQTKLRKYSSAFNQQPAQEAIVRAKIGWRQTQLGAWWEGVTEFVRALHLAPTSRTVYYYVGVALYYQLRRLCSSARSQE